MKTEAYYMETVLQTKTKEILDHHLSAFLEADVGETLKGFYRSIELLTPQGLVKGLDAIRTFFEDAYKIIPKGSRFELKQQVIKENLGYFYWTVESPFVSIPCGTDTFIIEGDKILFQTLAAHIIPKQ